jgi:hypothetical protein
MRSQKSLIKIGIIIPFLGLFFSACTLDDKLRWLDERSGDVLEIVAGESPQDSASTSSSVLEKEAVDFDAMGFSQDAKAKIDDWLKNNNLNRYGDPIGTNYEKGTPLIDASTGANIDRFDYILGRVPDLMDKIKQQ